VFDGTVVEVMHGHSADGDGRRDDRVLLGIGAIGARPRAYVVLCPCDGIRQLVDELRDAGSVAAENHVQH